MAAVLRRFSMGSLPKSQRKDSMHGIDVQEHTSNKDESDAVKADPAPRVPPRMPTSHRRRASLGANITRSLSRKLSLSKSARGGDDFDSSKQYYYQPAQEVDSKNVVASKQLDVQLKSMLAEESSRRQNDQHGTVDAIVEDLQEASETIEKEKQALKDAQAATYTQIEQELGEQLRNFEQLLQDKKKGPRSRNMVDIMNDSQTSLNTKLSALDGVIATDFREFL